MATVGDDRERRREGGGLTSSASGGGGGGGGGGGAGGRGGPRTLAGELEYITSTSAVRHEIAPGFVPHMRVPGTFYVNAALLALQMEELTQYASSGGVGGFLPAVKQIANVAALPGIVHRSIGLPDLHSGYGFAIGNVAAFDMADPAAIVSPGGVGFDINCGVRLVRTNLFEADVAPLKETLTQALYDHIPVGVGSKGIIPTGGADLEAALEMGMDWSLREGYAWAEDKEHCLAPDTVVLRADGRVARIGDCTVGDTLVDGSGAPTPVVRASTGVGALYEVAYAPSNALPAASFVCNAGHRLVLAVATAPAVAACDAGGVTVSYTSVRGCGVSATPVRHTVRHDTAAAAAAFAAALPSHATWEPTVTQYCRLVARDASLAAACFMVRAPCPARRGARVAPFSSHLPVPATTPAAACGYAVGQALGGNRTAHLPPFLQSTLAAAGSDAADVECAFLADTADVRRAVLAGLLDGAAVEGNGRRGVATASASPAVAMLAHRLATSLGLPTVLVGDVAYVDVRSSARPTPHFVHFTVSPAGEGPYVSVEVGSARHTFLLADHLVVHNCEEYGRMLTADPSKVTKRAKKRGLPQLGTLGAGNHYAEIQVVDEIYDKAAAARMGIEERGQVCVMIHSGSRGLGHQVATDALVEMERAMVRDGIATNDRQLACARIASPEGQTYLAAMAAAANYAWVNRASMTFLTRQAFAKVFDSTPDDLDMHVIYDVSHNIAKVEEHLIDGRPRKLLVHRKGATRAFPPHHPLIPVDYQFTGQPVLIGGTMGTCSYVLTGTERGMADALGSTCHGAGRAASRAKSRRTLTYDAVLESLEAKGISFRLASPKLVMEEAPESYKDVTAVVDTCHEAGISSKAIKLRPIGVVKG